jgi:type I restriction enzyme S subunit
MGLSMGESVLGEVPSGWLVSTVGAVFKEFEGRIQTGPFGSQLHASDYVEVGIPTVMPANIGDNRIIEPGISRIRPEDVERLKRHKLQVGDIVFSRRGDVERRSLVRGHEVGWLCGTGCLLVRPPSGYVDSAFLAHWFGHPVIRAWLTQHAIGATMLNINTEILSSVPLVLPHLNEQQAIAEVLGALDDKIESNRRTIRTLDEFYMAECELALSTSSENVSLGKVASLSLGGTPSKENSSFWEGGDIPWINSGRLHEFPVLTPSDFITLDGLSKSATKLIPKGSTVVAITGATLGVVSRLAIDTAINQSIVAVECRGNVVLNGFMLYALRANMAELVSSATGAAQQHVNKANFEELVISIPAAEGDRLLQNIPDLLGKVDALAHENVTLSLLRNTLLPELLSGRLRVKDAESMMENV